MHSSGHFGQKQSQTDACWALTTWQAFVFLARFSSLGNLRDTFHFGWRRDYWLIIYCETQALLQAPFWMGSLGICFHQVQGPGARSWIIDQSCFISWWDCNSIPVQVDLRSSMKGNQASWHGPGKGLCLQVAMSSHEASGDLEKILSDFSKVEFCEPLSKQRMEEAQEVFSRFVLIKCVQVSELLGVMLLLTEK